MADATERRADRDAMLDVRMQTLPEALAAWRNADAVRADWTEFLDEEFARCDDIEWARDFHAKINRAKPNDYLQRIVEADGARHLCAIRFLGGDRDRPFVDIYGSTRPNTDITAVAEAAINAYDAFNPTAARDLWAGTQPPELRPGWRARGDLILCAGRLTDVLDAPPPPNLDHVRIEAAPLDEAEAYMHDAYDAFRRRAPALAKLVPPATRDQLERAARDGRLMWWTLDDQRVGVIAVQPERWIGLRGWHVVEEIAGPSPIRKRTAAAAQRRVVESLHPHDPDGVLFGVVAFENHPSRRVVARVGRREIAAWWFIERTNRPTL